jgi:hypothetical protein
MREIYHALIVWVLIIQRFFLVASKTQKKVPTLLKKPSLSPAPTKKLKPSMTWAWSSFDVCLLDAEFDCCLYDRVV